MSYYETIEEDLKRAKEILERGKAESDLRMDEIFPQPDIREQVKVLGGTIYGEDTYAAYKLLESFVQEIEKYQGLFSDYEEPCTSFEQAQAIWNDQRRWQKKADRG